MRDFFRLEKKITSCKRCPRLIRYCQKIAETKKREFREFSYWGMPVPGFGDPLAKLWIIGLAPAAHGANRTGRMFTGDGSGRWLFSALHEIGLSDRQQSRSREDGLRLHGVYISAVVRCAPPDNKPLPKETSNCQRYLEEEIRLLKNVKIVLALGHIAFQASLRLLFGENSFARPRPKFSHGGTFSFGKYTLIGSYHPSRQNTQTGRLTREMWITIFSNISHILDT